MPTTKPKANIRRTKLDEAIKVLTDLEFGPKQRNEAAAQARFEASMSQEEWQEMFTVLRRATAAAHSAAGGTI